jgi:hypothetical protein
MLGLGIHQHPLYIIRKVIEIARQSKNLNKKVHYCLSKPYKPVTYSLKEHMEPPTMDTLPVSVANLVLTRTL